MQLYLANSGAAGTFLEDLDVTDFRYHGNGPSPWSGIDEKTPPGSTGVGKGTVFERGDAHLGYVHASLALSADVARPEDVARRGGEAG